MLGKRTTAPVVDAQFFASSSVRECFDEGDKKQLDKLTQTLSCEATASYIAELKAFRASVAAQKRPSEQPRKKQKRAAASSGTQRAKPLKLDTVVLSSEDALSYLPEGSRCWKSRDDNRWRVTYDGAGYSRSWVYYGEMQAFMLCAKWCWDRHTEGGGEGCPWAEIANIDNVLCAV